MYVETLTTDDAPSVVDAIQEGETDRVETATEAAVEIATVEAAAAVQIAEAQAEAAVEIAEAQAAATEIDEQWLQSEFAGVRDALAALSLQMEQVLAGLASIAGAMVEQLTPTPPPTLTEPTPDLTPAPAPTPPDAEAAPQAAETPRRRRRLF
jgi:hypothetical protein